MDSVNKNWSRTSLIGYLIGGLTKWGQSSWLIRWSSPLSGLLIALVLSFGPFASTNVLGILLLGVAGFWLFLTLAEEQKSYSGWIDKLVLLYWGIATVATAFSPVKTAALDGWIKLTLYLLFFAMSARVLRSPRLGSWLITLLLLISLIVSVYGIRQEIFGVEQLATWNDPDSPLAQNTRVYSYLGNPNLLAGYLLGAIALSLGAIFVWQGWLGKSLATTIFLVNSVCVYFTDSRGGWLALGGLLATFAILLYYRYYQLLPRGLRKWLIPVVITVITVVITIAFFRVETLRLRLLSLFAGREDSSNNFRLNVWAAVLEMIRDYPIIGIGPGGEAFQQIYPLYMRPNYTSLGAYSIYLETTVETGLIGISCFLGIIGMTFYRGFVNLKKAIKTDNLEAFWLIGAIAALVGLLIQGLADVIWYRPQVNTLWWFLVGLIASFDFVVRQKTNNF